MRLSHKDFDALQESILSLNATRNLAAFKHDLPKILQKIIRCDVCIWARFALGEHPKMTSYAESSPRLTREIIANWENRVLDHPFTKYFAKTKDVSALKISDFVNLQQMRNSW